MKNPTKGALASSSRGVSRRKPSRDVFRIQSYIQDDAFTKIVNDKNRYVFSQKATS